VQEKINRGRHTDHPAGRKSIWTNQCPPSPSPHFLQARCHSCHPTNSVKALKAEAKPEKAHKMLNLNKYTKTKPKPTVICKNCSYVCAYHCAQLLYTTQHRTVLMIFPLILQTVIIAQMMSTGEDGKATMSLVITAE